MSQTMLQERLLAEIVRGSAVLDVGCGLAHYHQALAAHAGRVTLLDAHAPYLDQRRSVFGDRFEYREHAVGIARLNLPFDEREFDVVLAFDVIEHLHQDEGNHLLHELRRVGNKALVFCPEGDHPQDRDVWGLGGDYWQRHRSVWTAADFIAAGWDVEVWKDFHAEAHPDAPNALWAVAT